MRNKIIFLTLLIMTTIICSFLSSCNPNPNTQIPEHNADTEYIEGDLGNKPNEGVDGENNDGEINDGEVNDGEVNDGEINNNEGSYEGESTQEGENFTSAVVFDHREVDFGEPEPTTEEGETTNRELIEPDIIRKWGNYLLVLNQFKGLTIVDLSEKSVVSNLQVYGYPRDLYIKGTYAIILLGYTISHTIENDEIIKTTGSKAIIIDISNQRKPEIITSFFLPGDFIDSRIVGEILYAVTSDYQYIYETDTSTSSETIWTVESGSKCWITSIDLTNPSSPKVVEEIDFPGYGTIIQATDHSIYVCSPDWNNGNTLITYVDISNPEGKITPYSPVQVPGYIADKFKLDEWQNYLRVVSNTFWENRNTYITIFDVSNPGNITQCSQTLLPEAEGETLYATRFAENYLYLVTYLTMDPLFVVDLSNPNQPEVKGVLHVPGWSIHIEPTESHQLIALGVDDQNNQRRVKVSWFDVSDPSNPTEVSTVSIGEGWTWSSAYSDVKAFTILDKYIIVPFSGWNGNYYSEQIQFIKWQLDERQLLPLGAVTLRGHALRTIKNNDFFYSVTPQYIHEIALNESEIPILTGVDIPLTEYVADVIEINYPNNLVEITTDIEKSLLTLKLKNTQDEIIDTLTIKTTGYFNETVKINDEVFGIVLNEWGNSETYEYNYRAILVKVNTTTDPPKFEIIKDCKIPLAPPNNWGYVYYDMYSIRPLPYPYYWYYGNYIPNEFIFSVGDKLIIRGTGQNFDINLGDETVPFEGFAIVDTSPNTETKTIGLGFANIVNLIESSGRIFLTTQKFIETENPPLTSYYLSEILLDPLKITTPLNVPGVIISINSTADIYFLKDWQYLNPETPPLEYYYPQYETWFRTIKIIEGKVSIIDSINTKLSWAQFYHDISDNLIYLSNQNNLLTLFKYEISNEGKFINYSEKVLGTSLWGDIIYCKKPYAYLSIDSASALILNLYSEQGIQFSNLIQLNSYPNKYRIGNEYIYIISGYSGWSKINL